MDLTQLARPTPGPLEEGLRRNVRPLNGGVRNAGAFQCTAVVGIDALWTLMLSANLREGLGEIGLVVSATVAGLVDTHSPAVAVATLAASGKTDSADAVGSGSGGAVDKYSQQDERWLDQRRALLRTAADPHSHSCHRIRVGRHILDHVIAWVDFYKMATTGQRFQSTVENDPFVQFVFDACS